jgi:hypothetical protein
MLLLAAAAQKTVPCWQCCARVAPAAAVAVYCTPVQRARSMNCSPPATQHSTAQQPGQDRLKAVRGETVGCQPTLLPPVHTLMSCEAYPCSLPPPEAQNHDTVNKYQDKTIKQ